MAPTSDRMTTHAAHPTHDASTEAPDFGRTLFVTPPPSLP